MHYVTRQIKTFTLIFLLITYVIPYLKIEENNSEKTFFFSYGFRHVTRGGEGGEVSPGLFQKFEKSALI